MGYSNIIVGYPFSLSLSGSSELFTKCNAKEVGMQMGKFGAPKIVCSFNLVGDSDNGIILLGYAYSVKPFLEFYCAVFDPGAKGSVEEGDMFSRD